MTREEENEAMTRDLTKTLGQVKHEMTELEGLSRASKFDLATLESLKRTFDRLSEARVSVIH